MRSHEHINSYNPSSLAVKGEVYDELEQDRELDQLSDELEARRRRTEVSQAITGESIKPIVKLNAWERMAAKLPGFNRERAERARAEKEKEIREMERFKAAEKIIESGDVKGYEEELSAWLKDEDVKDPDARDKIDGYRRFLVGKEIHKNPEKIWKLNYVANWELLEAEKRHIESVKRMTDNAKNSIEQIYRFRENQIQEQYRLKRLEDERIEKQRAEQKASQQQAANSTYESWSGHAESPKPKESSHESSLQSYEAPVEIPDQGPDLTDLTSPLNPFNPTNFD